MKSNTQGTALACAVSLALLSGCATTTSPSAPRQATRTTTAPPPTVISRDGLALITEAQVARIREAIGGKAPTSAIGQAIAGAAPTIEAFLQAEGCITARNGAMLNAFAVYGRPFDGAAFQGGPMSGMEYQDKTACVTVERIQNWQLASPTLLRFEVVYVGDDGEERALRRHELVREPKGNWLFTR